MPQCFYFMATFFKPDASYWMREVTALTEDKKRLLTMSTSISQRRFTDRNTVSLTVNCRVIRSDWSRAAISDDTQGPLIDPCLFIEDLNNLCGAMNNQALLFADDIQLVAPRNDVRNSRMRPVHYR